ncbi:MAG: hypothetical protein ACI97P_000807 [Arcticibacterium sp.]|jgi:hypothetical protein
MKKLLFVAAALLFVSSYSFSQASPKKTADSDKVSVSYSAPSMKGREIFGGLVPFGKVWRTGANDATEITFKKAVNFGGQDVAAGTYSLFTIPSEDGNWTIILNPARKQWGAYEYGKIKAGDLPHITAKAGATDASVELFDISVDANAVTIAWENIKVAIPVK